MVGEELGLRGALARQTCLLGSATGRTGLAQLCLLHGEGERLQAGSTSQALAVAAAPPWKGPPGCISYALKWYSGVEMRAYWRIFLFRIVVTVQQQHWFKEEMGLRPDVGSGLV